MLYPGEPVIITHLLKNINDVGSLRKALMKYTFSFCSLFPIINYSKRKDNIIIVIFLNQLDNKIHLFIFNQSFSVI